MQNRTFHYKQDKPFFFSIPGVQSTPVRENGKIVHIYHTDSLKIARWLRDNKGLLPIGGIPDLDVKGKYDQMILTIESAFDGLNGLSKSGFVKSLEKSFGLIPIKQNTVEQRVERLMEFIIPMDTATFSEYIRNMEEAAYEYCKKDDSKAQKTGW